MFTNPFRIILQPTMTLMEEGSEEPLENTSQVSLATWQALVDSAIVNPNSVTTLFEPVADRRKCTGDYRCKLSSIVFKEDYKHHWWCGSLWCRYW